MKLAKYKNKIILFLILLLSSGLLIYSESKKAGYHEDEVYSISSSVSEIWKGGLLHRTDEKGIPLWKSKEEVKDTISLTSTNKGTLKDVYQNQVDDVHPPLFYLVVYFVSSIFPDFFLHNVFLVNFFFFLLTNFILIKICKEMKKDKFVVPTLLFYDFSIIAINTFTFQRMYGMLTFFGLASFYFNLKLMNQDFVFKKSDFIGLFLVTVLGFLTQYFFVIYALIEFLVMVVTMFKEKKWSSLRRYFLLHVVAAGVGLLCFPASISHILFGGRGVGSFGNAHYFSRFIQFCHIITENINFPMYFIVAFFALILVKKKEKWTYLLTIPILVYFLLMVKIVPFLEVRYIMMIFPLLILCLVSVGVEEFNEHVTIGVILFLVLSGFYLHKPQFLYSSYQGVLDKAKENQNYSAVFLIDNDFTYIKDAFEMTTYKQSKVVNVSNDELKTLKDDEVLLSEESFILRMETYLDSDQLLQQMKEMGYHIQKELYKDTENIVYLMEKKE